MTKYSSVKRLRSITLFGLPVLTIIVTPWFTLDGVNLPKLLVLSTCAGAIAFNVKPLFRTGAYQPKLRLYLISVFIFALLSVVSQLATGSFSLKEIYGGYGRNTGLLTYLLLSIFATAAALIADDAFVKRFLNSLIAVGLLNALYGLLQNFGIEPLPWTSPYNPIVGTLGNPNFVSALLGVCSICLLSQLVQGPLKNGMMLLWAMALAFTIFILIRNESIQGVLIFALGAAFLLILRATEKFSSWMMKVSIVTSFLIAGSLVLLGSMRIGPFTSILGQETFKWRLEYWRVGLKIVRDNPLIGIGFDNYGDYFREYRSLSFVESRGLDVTSDSSHNLLIDILAGGGIPLGLVFIVTNLLVLTSGVRMLRLKSDRFSSSVLVLVYFGLLAQSLISVVNIALAVWQFVAGGLIVGIDASKDKVMNKVLVRQKHSAEVDASTSLLTYAGFVIGLLLAFLPFRNDYQFKKSLESGQPYLIVTAARSKPLNDHYLFTAARVLTENNRYTDARGLLEEAVKDNPRNYLALKLLYGNPEISDFGRAKIRDSLQELDPQLDISTLNVKD